MPQNPASEHTFLVTVSGCDRDQAEQVIAERINHDEDYGFDYQISHRDHRPSPRVAVCKCPAGDIQVTYPDGRAIEYIRQPEEHQHGAEVVDKPKRTATAITLDAESVKAEVQDRFTNSQDHGLSEKDLNLVLAADDEHIGQLVSNLVDDSFWAEYDDVRSRVIDQLLSEGP